MSNPNHLSQKNHQLSAWDNAQATNESLATALRGKYEELKVKTKALDAANSAHRAAIDAAAVASARADAADAALAAKKGVEAELANVSGFRG